MRYEGRVFRPPSEADAYIVQATIGCSWNHCTYCDMYIDKRFRVRELAETLADIEAAGRRYGLRVEKLFVADGDALILDLDHWRSILEAARAVFPNLRRVSAYATAITILEKTPSELRRLRELGLSLLYVGPESGDAVFRTAPRTARRRAAGRTAEQSTTAFATVTTGDYLGGHASGGCQRTQEPPVRVPAAHQSGRNHPGH